MDAAITRSGSSKLPRSNYASKLRDFPGVAFENPPFVSHRGNWRDFFRARIGPTFDGRVILEVGCFDAAYLSRIATNHPRTAFVGLDWKAKAVYDGARRITEHGLRNVALVRGRGQDLLRIFGNGELDEVWVFHPDPFAGPGELKNRLIAEPFLLDVHAVLRNQASTLSLKTDHPGYFQWALGLFGSPSGDALRQRFKVVANSADFWNDPAALAHASGRCFSKEATLFESRFLKRRLPIHYFEIAKR